MRLEITDLRVWFTQYERGLRRRVVHAVDAMSLSVDAGEVVALVGASGAGKTLLGQAVLGLLPPNAGESGTVAVGGRVVPPAERRALAGREVGLLPQSVSHLDPTATVGAQLTRSARLAGAPYAGAVAALEARGLDRSVLRRYPHELSGGMARRVLTTMALLADPSVVIADEPTPGLHPASAAAVLSGLRDLADRGAGVLLITHDLTGALTVADRVVVCDRGRTLVEAPVADFAGDGSALGHPYARALWRALPENGFTPC